MSLAVLGAGSFGTAVANHAARKGHEVVLWCRTDDQARYINEHRRNPRYLEDCPLVESLRATSDLGEALGSADRAVLALPTQSLRGFLERLAPLSTEGHSFLSLAKGIEIATGLMPRAIFEEVLPGRPYSALSGPSHAEEVVRELPTAVIVASADPSEALGWQTELNSPRFRVYTSGDVTGAELGGAVKNIIAIAVGIAHSLSAGDNAKAALATRGLAEIMRLGTAMGASPLTLAGLAGVGDLMATCYSQHSRNFRFGAAIGRGASPEAAAAEIGQVVEGAHTTRALVAYARRAGIELPISEGVHAILYEGAALQDVIDGLLFRDPKPE